MDAASGRYRTSRPESWVADPDATFIAERSGFTGLVEGCAALGGSNGANCIYVQDEDGSTLSAFSVESDAFGYALSSSGRELVALFRTLSGFQAGDWVLEVYRSDGLLLDRFPLEPRGYGWVSEDRLLLVGNDQRTLFLTDPGAASVDFTLTPTNVDGLIVGSPVVSPDGTRVAFCTIAHASEGVGSGLGCERVWMLTYRGREGSEVREIAALDDAVLEAGKLVPISWSPDGRFLMIGRGYRGGIPPDTPVELALGLGSAGYTSVLDVDVLNETVRFDADFGDGASLPEGVVVIRRERFSDGSSPGRITSSFPAGAVWRE